MAEFLLNPGVTAQQAFDVIHALQSYSNNGTLTLDNSLTWDDVKARYEFVEVHVRETGGSGRSYSGQVKTEYIAAGRAIHVYSTGSNFANLNSISATTLGTANVQTHGGNDPVEIVVYGVKSGDVGQTRRAGARLEHRGDGGSFTIPDTFADLVFSNVDYQVLASANAGTGEITVTEDGDYRVSFYASFNAVTNDYDVRVTLNGGVIKVARYNGGAEGAYSVDFGVLPLTAGDVVGVEAESVDSGARVVVPDVVASDFVMVAFEVDRVASTVSAPAAPARADARIIHAGSDGVLTLPGAQAAIPFASTAYNNLTTTNPAAGSITVTEAGDYRAVFFISANDMANDIRVILKLDAVEVEQIVLQSGGGETRGYIPFGIIAATAGQVFSVESFTVSGSNDAINPETSDANLTVAYFEVERV